MSIRGHHQWEGSCSARWPYLIIALEVILAVVLLAFGLVFAAILVIVATLPILVFTTIEVSCGQHGLTIRYGPLQWPTQTIDLARIDTASVVDIEPLKWGGWGYRGSLKVFKRAAVNLRKGPGIRLDLVDGRIFAVTVDEPALGVNVLNQAIVMRPPS